MVYNTHFGIIALIARKQCLWLLNLSSFAINIITTSICSCFPRAQQIMTIENKRTTVLFTILYSFKFLLRGQVNCWEANYYVRLNVMVGLSKSK